MRHFIRVLAFALLFIPAFGGEPPDSRWSNGMDLSWAFPDPSADFPPEDNSVVKHVPGSSKSYTQGQIDDIYNPPDWFPDEHVPFPNDLCQLAAPLTCRHAYRRPPVPFSATRNREASRQPSRAQEKASRRSKKRHTDITKRVMRLSPSS